MGHKYFGVFNRGITGRFLINALDRAGESRFLYGERVLNDSGVTDLLDHLFHRLDTELGVISSPYFLNISGTPKLKCAKTSFSVNRENMIPQILIVLQYHQHRH